MHGQAADFQQAEVDRYREVIEEVLLRAIQQFLSDHNINNFTNYGIVGRANAATIMVGQHVHAIVGQDHPTASKALAEMGEIDSFRGAPEVPPEQVTGFANPLVLPERVVKQLLARLLGEPFVPNDWGGEHDDLYTTRVTFRGRPTPHQLPTQGRWPEGYAHPLQARQER